MGPRTLRARLTFWHAGLLTLTLAGLSIIIVVALREVLYSRADAQLLSYATEAAEHVGKQLRAAGTPANGRATLLLRHEREWNRLLQVVDTNSGAVLEMSPGLFNHPLPRSATARRRARSGEHSLETIAMGTDHPLRVASVPVRVGNRCPYFVQAATPLTGVEEVMQRTSTFLLILTPSVFVISLIGGWLLVRRSLGRVDQITRMALAIKPESLNARLEGEAADDEIGRLVTAFNRMIARLETSFGQIRQFSANASHELKTPLTTVRGEAEVALMSERSPEEYRKALRSIIDEVERMTAIVDNLLLLARADSQQIDMKQEPVALHDVLTDVYVGLEPIARRKGVAVFFGEVEAVELQSDTFWISQVISNLLSNAIKYTPAGGTVTLSLEAAPAPSADAAKPAAAAAWEARVAVADTGPGIPEDQLPHIFDRFYRGDPGRSRETGGVGLGLNIAQMVIRLLGGRIEVRTRLKGGTTFVACLPLHSPPGP